MKKNKFSKVKKVNLPILNTPIIKNKGSTMNSLPKKDRTLVAKRTFKSKKVSSPSKKTTIKLKVNLLPNNPSKEKLIQQDVALTNKAKVGKFKRINAINSNKRTVKATTVEIAKTISNTTIEPLLPVVEVAHVKSEPKAEAIIAVEVTRVAKNIPTIEVEASLPVTQEVNSTQEDQPAVKVVSKKKKVLPLIKTAFVEDSEFIQGIYPFTDLMIDKPNLKRFSKLNETTDSPPFLGWYVSVTQQDLCEELHSGQKSIVHWHCKYWDGEYWCVMPKVGSPIHCDFDNQERYWFGSSVAK